MNPTRSTVMVGRSVAIAIALVISVGSAFAAQESVLYRFKGGNDGAAPYTGMTADAAGNLYGTTVDGGGSENCGTVFELSPPTAPGGPWTEAVLFGFSAGGEGCNPWGGLIFDEAGNLYGTTAGGGLPNCSGFSGCGIVFELSPSAPGAPWTETVLYSFAGGNDGANPWAGVIMDTHGDLYGTTRWGGSVRNMGAAFELSPPTVIGDPWTETLIHIFGGQNDGANPVAALTFGPKGALYGVTPGGRGSGQYGIVFKVRPPATQGGNWTEGIIYRFTNGSDGSAPISAMISDRSGNLYGTASSGGQNSNGVVFEISFSANLWTETVLYTFTGGNDGSAPVGSLVADKAGNLYGTTESGGQGRSGSVFELSPGAPWTETTLYDFMGGHDGQEPYAGLVFGKGGHLFGTTPNGGKPYGVGTLFAIGP